MATHGVEFADVSFTVGGRSILRDVSLCVEHGTTTALLGRSGSGKTTLLRTVNALVRPTGGRVLVNGQDVATDDVIALRRGIGYVIQETELFPHMTVERNVGMALELAGKPREEIRRHAAEMLRMVGLPEDNVTVTAPGESIVTSSPDPGSTSPLQFSGSVQDVPLPPPSQLTAESRLRASSGSMRRRR